MKTLVTVLVVAGAAAAGIYLYRRGKSQHDALGQEGGIPETIKAGVAAVVASVKSSSPSSSPVGEKDGASVATPTEAAADPRISQRVATESRWDGFLSLKTTSPPIRGSDLIAQGIAR
jgi:hypothetical protein